MKYSYPLHGSWNSQSQPIVSLILLLGVMLVAHPAAATTYNWTGNSATSGRWGDSGNWSPTGTPGNGDSVSFARVNSILWTFPTNDISGLSLNQIVLSTNYTPIGNTFTVTGAIYCTNVVGTAFVSNSIILGAGGVTLVVSNAANLELCGQISGSGNLTKLGTGTLTYQYNGGNNINTGTTYVYQGLVQVNVSGPETFGGPLVIAQGNGTAATVQYLQSYEISTVPITVNGAGVLDLHGFSDSVGPNLTLNDAATIETGTGILYLTSGTTVTYNAGAFSSATISGKLDASSGTCTFAASSSGLFSGDLVITAVLSDSATIHKTGNGYLVLDGANTYSGLMSVENGILAANNAQALGLSSTGVVVTNNASLALWVPSDVTEPLVLGSTALNGALEGLSTNIWGGPITLSGNTIIDVNSSCILSLSNAISGTGNVTEIGGGVLEYVGNHQNTYVGTTYVSQSTLILSNTAESGYAIPGALVVNTNSLVEDWLQFQIDSPYDAVTLYESSQFIMEPGANEWIGPLTMQGAQIISDGTLYLGGGLITIIEDTNSISEIDGTASLWTAGPTVVTNTGGPYHWADLYISANVSGETGNSGIIKTGTGTFGLGGVNTFGGGIVVSNGGLSLLGSGCIDSTNAGVVVSSNAFMQLLGNVNVGAVPLTLAGTVYSMFTNSWAGNITLVGNSPFFGVSGGSDVLTLSGIISGTGSCTVEGPGNVWFSGPNNNPYTGPTFVEEGTLVLNAGGVHAYGGPLVIGGLGYPATVRLAQFEELNQGQPLTINGGTLDLNNFYDYTPTNITLNAATIMSEAGTLYVTQNTVVTNSSDSIISGNLYLSGNFTLNSGGVVDISAAIGGGSNFITGGPLYTVLESSNSYTGPTIISGGGLVVNTPYSLGTTNNSVIVSNNASLMLSLVGGITNKTLVLNGQGLMPDLANLCAESGSTNYWVGPITVNGNCLIGLGSADSALHLEGPISGPGGIEVASNYAGILPLYLDGPGANTYSGATIVDAGTLLLLNKLSAFTAIPGPCFLSGTMRQMFYGQQMYTQPLTIYDGGLFDLNGFYAYCAAFNGTPGAAVTLSGAEFIPDFSSLAGQACAFNGVISGAGYVLHNGLGTLTLSNTNTYTNTTIVAGIVQINGHQPLCTMIVSSGATLCGTGQVGNVTCNGAISPGGGSAPGYGVGILTVSNLIMSGTASFNADLFGPAPGSYDQLVILGTNYLGGAALTLNPAFSSKPVHLGDSMMIISNALVGEPLGGFFAGVVGGTPINVGGYQFMPSYTAGDGNDFTLTDSGIPAGALPGQIIGGNGNQAIDFDECDEISFAITNTGPVAMNGASAVLSSTTPFVVVTQPYSTYPNIASSASATNRDWYEISTLPQFSGGTTINLQLTVTSSDGTFVIPFTVATEASIDGGGTCGSCLATITNNITGSDPVETGEIKPAGATSSYGAPKAWPGNFFGSYHYKVFTFTNTLATDAAVTVLVNAGCDVEAVAYVPAFTPSNISSNYAGDAGYYTIGGAANFSFDAPAGSQFQIVVNEYTVNAGCSQYTLQLDGLPCPPPILSIQPASTNKVQLTWPTWAGGFNLENASIVTGPGWVGNTNQPVVTQGLFSVTNGAASTNLFFRLHKP